MSEPAPATSPLITPRHYQAMCGLALAGVVLIQMQQSSLMPIIAVFVSVLIGGIGVLGILYRARLSPLYVLVAIAAPQVIEPLMFGNRGFQRDPRLRGIDLADVLLCMAALTYFIGHYRLQGLWFGVVPGDPRVGDSSQTKPTPPRVRSEASLNVTELIALVFTVPTIAVVAQIACLLLYQQWDVVDLPLPWQPFLLVAWTLLLTMFLFAHAFRHWRRLQMDRVSAMLMLQDMLWHETRGEQRRINRWLAWMKLRQRK